MAHAKVPPPRQQRSRQLVLSSLWRSACARQEEARSRLSSGQNQRTRPLLSSEWPARLHSAFSHKRHVLAPSERGEARDVHRQLLVSDCDNFKSYSGACCPSSRWRQRTSTWRTLEASQLPTSRLLRRQLLRRRSTSSLRCVAGSQRRARSTPLDERGNETSYRSQLKRNITLIERAVSTKEPRFTARALRQVRAPRATRV